MIGKKIFQLVFLTCFSALLAQSASAAITVSGQVGHQESNTLLAGVTVKLTGGAVNLTTQTDANGQYSFGSVAAGQYTLSASKTGYQMYPPAVSGDMFSNQWREFTASGPVPSPLPSPTPGAPVQAWASYYDGPGGFNENNPVMALDAADNVYVTATSYNVFNRFGDKDVVVMKYDPNGNLQWSKRFGGTGNLQDDPSDIRTDAAGNVYVTGSLWNGVEPDFDIFTVKFDTNGNQLWMKIYNGTADYVDLAEALRLDAAGNVYVTGYSVSNNNGRIDNNFVTLKYDTNGNQLWKREFDGGFDDGADELELDASGNVYVMGTSVVYNGGATSDIITVKYDTNGTHQWINRYDSHSSQEDLGVRFELDAQGNVFVMGEIWVRETWEALLIKINGSTGNNLWTRSWSNSNGAYPERPLAFTVDAGGNAILTGSTYYSTADQNVDAFTVKYSPTGTLLWQKIFNGPSTNGFDGDNQLAVDAQGNIYVGLSSQGFNNYDLTLVKYLPDGTQSYSYRFDNPEDKDDLFWGFENAPRGNSLLLDSQGNIYMTGDSTRVSAITGVATIDISTVKLSVLGVRRAQNDFDGDGKSDVAIYRPAVGEWWLNRSAAGSVAYQFGTNTDVIVPADYTGDGKTDAAFWRPSTGEWFILRSENSSYYSVPFGASGDIPAIGDYDGDGQADLAVWRPSTLTWYIQRSSGGTIIRQFGAAGDKPVAADFDGDGKTDIAIWRGSTGEWWINRSTAGVAVYQFGNSTDQPLAVDFTGDGRADAAVFRPATGEWFVLRSENQSYYSFPFGQTGDIPLAGDYDGDGKADAAIFRNGTWFINGSSAGVSIRQYGVSGDQPVLSAAE
ncbi:MAG TPA: FG-GAP-like repeat-containing protein [Pyrinomonadaceae bacterium]|jgi:hypothetical protein